MRVLISCFFLIFTASTMQASEITTIHNGSRPTQSIRHWHLKQQWKVSADDDLFFGRIIDVKMDPHGNTYILDYQTQEVTVLDPKGKPVKMMGRQGEGPGETTLARKIFLKKDGGIGLLEAMPASVVWLKDNGDPDGKTVVNPDTGDEGLVGCMSGTSQFGHLVMSVDNIVFAEGGTQSTTRLVGVMPDGNISHTYRTLPDDAYLKGTRDGVVNEGESYQQLWNRWDVDPAGNLWFADQRDQYLVHCATPEGVIIKSFTRDGQRPMRSKASINKIKKSLTENYSQSKAPIIVGENDPWVNQLWITDNSWGCEIWIESAASFDNLPDGVMVRYDLFNTDGEFRNQVDIVGTGDPLFDRWYVFQGRQVIMVRNINEGGFDFDDETNPRFDDTDLEVICYRVLWEE